MKQITQKYFNQLRMLISYYGEKALVIDVMYQEVLASMSCQEVLDSY